MPVKLPRCKTRRCHKPARIGGYCKGHAVKKADQLFSLAVREDAKCAGATSFWKGPTFQCGGALQCCHFFSRRYRNTRWDYRNVAPMCAGHHRWFDTHPIERDDMMLEQLGIDYEELRRQALDPSHDWYEDVAYILEVEDADGA